MNQNMMEREEQSPFLVNSTFWNTWQGKIIRSIVLNRCFTKKEMFLSTKLDEQAFDKGFEELLTRSFIEIKEDGKIFANKALFHQCMVYYAEKQEEIANWVKEWADKHRVHSNYAQKLEHFNLTDKALAQFSDHLIEQANFSIVVANPFVKKCFITDTLTNMSQKGVNVFLLTRKVEPQQYRNQLENKGIKLCEDDAIHAKLIVVDQRVAVVSSMNFYAGSAAGASWEAGIVTIDKAIVRQIYKSILEKYNDAIDLQNCGS